MLLIMAINERSAFQILIVRMLQSRRVKMHASDFDIFVIRRIVNAIVAKRTQISLCDRVKQIHLIGDVIVAKHIQITAVQTIGRSRQS